MTTHKQEPESKNRMERAKARPFSAPAIDILESAQEVRLLVDLPGVAEDDVTLDLDREELTIAAVRRPNGGRPEGQPVHGERAVGELRRVVRFSPDIDRARVQAQLAHGVLTVTLPKLEEVRPRRIALGSAG
jgi:HSP20 family protein